MLFELGDYVRDHLVALGAREECAEECERQSRERPLDVTVSRVRCHGGRRREHLYNVELWHARGARGSDVHDPLTAGFAGWFAAEFLGAVCLAEFAYRPVGTTIVNGNSGNDRILPRLAWDQGVRVVETRCIPVQQL